MAGTQRVVDTRFWSDNWVRKLNALDRYAFLYLITNDHSSWCGAYELPLSVMAFESGIDERDLELSILPKLSPKVLYLEGWVYIPNWIRYHMSSSGNLSPQQKKGMEEAWKLVPEKIRLKIREKTGNDIPYLYPIGGVSASTSTFTYNNHSVEKPRDENKMFNPPSENSDDLPVVDSETGKVVLPPKKPRKAKDRSAMEAVAYFQRACDRSTGTKPLLNDKGYYLALKLISEAHFEATDFRKMIDDWFAQNLPEDKAVQITHCFSAYNVNQFRARNPK